MPLNPFKFTEGPWHAKEQADAFWIYDNEGKPIACIPKWLSGDLQSNAELIAAAPTLFGAVRVARSNFSMAIAASGNRNTTKWLRQCRQACNNAIFVIRRKPTIT